MGGAALPSGIVTFLAFEIDDAGDLWDHDPDAMEVVCERLDGMISTLVEAWRGRMPPTEAADRMLAVFANRVRSSRRRARSSPPGSGPSGGRDTSRCSSAARAAHG